LCPVRSIVVGRWATCAIDPRGARRARSLSGKMVVDGRRLGAVSEFGTTRCAAACRCVAIETPSSECTERPPKFEVQHAASSLAAAGRIRYTWHIHHCDPPQTLREALALGQ